MNTDSSCVGVHNFENKKFLLKLRKGLLAILFESNKIIGLSQTYNLTCSTHFCCWVLVIFMNQSTLE